MSIKQKESTRSGLKVITNDNVSSELGKHIRNNFQFDIISPIYGVLESINEFAIAAALLPKTPAITIRIAAFEALLRVASRPSTAKDGETILYDLGWKIGHGFAISFLAFISKKYIVLDKEALIKAWSLFDSGANWGKFILEKIDEKEIEIIFDNNFLERSKVENKHEFCEFVAGYIHGVLWRIIKYHSRWVDREQGRFQTISLEPTRANEVVGENSRFRVSLKEEELHDAFDIEHELLTNPPTRPADFAAKLIQLIEAGIKAKVGALRHEQLSPRHLLIGMDERGRLSKGGVNVKELKVIIDKLEEIKTQQYSSYSNSMHHLWEFFSLVSENLKCLELIGELGRDTKTRAIRIARKREGIMSTEINVRGSGKTQVAINYGAGSISQVDLDTEVGSILEIQRGLIKLISEINKHEHFDEKEAALSMSKEILIETEGFEGINPDWVREKLTSLLGLVVKVTPFLTSVVDLLKLLPNQR